MDIADAKIRLAEIDQQLLDDRIVPFADFETPHGTLRLSLTDRLRNRCRREKKWKSRAFLVALTNACFGFNPDKPQIDLDGIFRLDRDHNTVNRMMGKVFDRFVDKPDPLVPMVEKLLDTPAKEWVGVRVVGEPIRLLGVYAPGRPPHIVLIDIDIVRS